jgi:hypothetical protein
MMATVAFGVMCHPRIASPLLSTSSALANRSSTSSSRFLELSISSARFVTQGVEMVAVGTVVVEVIGTRVVMVLVIFLPLKSSDHQIHVNR